MLVCGSADKSVYNIKMPPSLDKISTFAGREGVTLLYYPIRLIMMAPSIIK